MKIILGIVGEIAAGKTTISNYVKEKYSAESARFSDCLRDILKRMYIEETRQNLQSLSTVIRENFGQDIISKTMAQDLTNKTAPIIIAEGIRRPTDITFFKNLNGFNLIYITADAKTRWERLVVRQENPGDDQKTYEQFLKDEQAEADRLIKELGQKAKFTINNNGTLEELYKQVDTLITQIYKGLH